MDGVQLLSCTKECVSCADQESFVRVGPTLTSLCYLFLKFMMGDDPQIQTPLKCRFAGAGR